MAYESLQKKSDEPEGYILSLSEWICTDVSLEALRFVILLWLIEQNI